MRINPVRPHPRRHDRVYLPPLSRGLRSTITDAVKAVTHDGRRHNGRDVIYCRRLLGSLEIAEIGVTARFLMIAKGFIP
jgi:hypothetical protein